MTEQANQHFLGKMRAIILDINPDGVYRDARAAGLEVTSVEDFRKHPHSYWRIEDLMHQYARRAARFSAMSGASSGIGGVATAITLGAADMTHMAAQLYWLCQRLAVLNGFDPRNPLQRERTQEIYLLALGFDAAAQAVLKQQLGRAASIAGKRGAYSNYILKFVILVAEKLGSQLTTKQAGKLIPFLGGVVGAGMNYTFAKQAANRMIVAFKNEYFRTWQAGHKGPS